VYDTRPWSKGSGSHETFDFARRQLSSLAQGVNVAKLDPPRLDVLRRDLIGRVCAYLYFLSIEKSFDRFSIFRRALHSILP
jgi:hypothetical protein